MKLEHELAFDQDATKICRAMGVLATLVATKAIRKPTDRYHCDLEREEPTRRAPIDLLLEMASFFNVASFDDPLPFGLTILPEDEESGDELNYQSKVGRELIRNLPIGSHMYFIILDDSEVEIITREYTLQEGLYNTVGTALGSLTAPEWIFWRPCDYPLTSEGWLVLPTIGAYQDFNGQATEQNEGHLMNSQSHFECDGYATTICRAMGVLATLVATKAMREPGNAYNCDLEAEPVRRAPVDMLFEMATYFEVGEYAEPLPFGLTIPVDDEERDGLGGELGFKTKVARELIRNQPADSKLYVMWLDDSEVEIITREHALEEKIYSVVGMAIGSLTAPEWIFWRPCDYPQTTEAWLVLPQIRSYSGGERPGCLGSLSQIWKK